MDTPPKDNTAWASYIDSVKGKLPKGPFPQFPTPSPEAIRRSIDHTLLSESATEEHVHTLCAEAQQCGFASVCVRLHHVSNAAQDLKRANAGNDGARVGVTCVVGFPGGIDTTANKVAEARKAIELGASELDMVMNYPLLHEGKYREVYEDVAAVRAVASHPTVLKVILETSQLCEGEIVAGTAIVAMAGADYVKTSTGYKGQGATVPNVELMHAVVDATGNRCKVKASGGVRSAEDCVKMLNAGAARIGASSGVRISKELEGKALSEQGGVDMY